MDLKKIIKITLVSIGVLTLIILGLYFGKFSTFEFANNVGDWGAFGDYFGGILNPILAFINLLIVSYLTIHIINKDDEKHKELLYLSSKPLGHFIYVNTGEKIEITYKNSGNGPLIIKDLFFSLNKIKTDNLNEIFNNDGWFIRNPTWKMEDILFAQLSHSDISVIGSQDTIVILSLKSPNNKMMHKDALKLINRIEFHLVYTDLYNYDSKESFLKI